jgi:hypothetical protein|tara:strand:- start:518 stop:667 length:150 start_codon:yes stop_codon:yes gene_type:complete
MVSKSEELMALIPEVAVSLRTPERLSKELTTAKNQPDNTIRKNNDKLRR